MKTEFLLHGYFVVLIPRQGRAPETMVTAPYRVDQRFDLHDLDRWIGQLTRELEVIQAAKTMIAEASKP